MHTMLDKDVLNGVNGIYTDRVDKPHEAHDRAENESNERSGGAIPSRRYTDHSI